MLSHSLFVNIGRQFTRTIIQRVISLSPTLLLLLLACLAASPATPLLPRLIDLSPQDTFTKAGIRLAQQSEIAKLIEESSTDWERGRIAQMRVRPVALSPGKLNGLILHATAPEDCGGTGNCLLAVLRRQGSRWQVVLPEAFADGFGLSRTTHHGVYDLAVSANESADANSITLFAFDGSRYRRSKCYHVAGKVVTSVACTKTDE